MSTDQQQQPAQPHHKTPALETNALGEKLITGWQQFKQGQLVSYKAMAILLLVVTAIGLTIYILSEKSSVASKTWTELEGANSESALVDFAKAHPNTVAARIAELHVARYQLGPEGIDRLLTRDEIERKKATESIEKARETLEKLANEFKDDPVFRSECYLGLAKAEAALIGITKPGSTDFVGSQTKLTEWLDKLAETADGTPWGDDAKKLSASLKSGPLSEEMRRVQLSLYNMSLFPGLPPGGGMPLGPGGNHFGPGGLTPGIPGITGGPIAPDPKPPEKKPTSTDPKPPEKGTTPPTDPKPPEKVTTPPTDPKPPEKGTVPPLQKPPEPVAPPPKPAEAPKK